MLAQTICYVLIRAFLKKGERVSSSSETKVLYELVFISDDETDKSNFGKYLQANITSAALKLYC